MSEKTQRKRQGQKKKATEIADPLAEKIQELKKRIIENSRDESETQSLVFELSDLIQKRETGYKLVDIPLREIKEEIDLGPNKVYKTIRGYVYEAKGGMTTLIEHRMARVCAMFETLFELHKKAKKDKDKESDTHKLYEVFQAALMYVMQTPIFASLDEKSLFEISTAILHTFNDYVDANYNNPQPYEETEEDIKQNAELENISEGLDNVLNS